MRLPRLVSGDEEDGWADYPAPTLLHRGSILSRLDRLKAKEPSAGFMLSFYSSAVGGICTDPSLFFIPVDDHMVHRGHGVFDTCNVKEGRAYGLSFHLDRLLRSAELARIRHPYTREELRSIILYTIAAAGQHNGVFVRYWLSAGRGNFSVSPEGCTATFYCCVHDYSPKDFEGSSEAITSVPLKPPLLATIKSNNYMINALSAMEAQKDRNAGPSALGIQVNSEGYLAEASIANVAIVDANFVLRMPPFEGILAGTTAKRALVLAPSLLQEGYIEGFEMSPIHRSELDTAQELMLLGGGFCVPVVKLDGKPVGDGTKGPVAVALQALLESDMLYAEEYLDRIPYEQYQLEINERERDRLLHSEESCKSNLSLIGSLAKMPAFLVAAALVGFILGREIAKR